MSAVASAPGREIVAQRTFDAPRELVWSAWTHPEHIGRWWGPNGFTTTTSEFNLKPGGIWRFVMHGPDGRDYKNVVQFLEIVEPERLVYKHGGEADTEDVNFEVTVTFEDRNGQTDLTLRSVFPTVEERDRVARDYGAVEGAQQTLDRLAEHVAEMTR